MRYIKSPANKFVLGFCNDCSGNCSGNCSGYVSKPSCPAKCTSF